MRNVTMGQDGFRGAAGGMVQSLRTAVLLCGVGVMSAGTAAAASAQSAPTPAAITPGAFATLTWFEGRWVGSGGGFRAFHEEYRFLNDSTIEQRTYPDSTYSEPDGGSLIQLRDGNVRSWRNGTPGSMVTRLSGDTLRFESPNPGGNGFSWLKVAADHWRAILDRRGGDVVYEMRRFGG